MQYLLLIYENEQRYDTQTKEEGQAITAEYGALAQSLAQSGAYKGGNPLQPSRAATTVRVRNGKRETTDGPFAETREQLGGYFLIEANDLDEAIAVAEKMPAARNGAVEVRPVRPIMATV